MEGNKQAEDALTLGALGIGAFIVADLAHEAIGHGGLCLATGGTIKLLTSVFFRCGFHSRIIDAAGPLANLLLGSLFWAISLSRRNIPTHARLFLVFSMAFNLFWGSGYLIYSGIMNVGDWAYVIEGLQPVWLWRSFIVALGLVLYESTERALSQTLWPFASSGGEGRSRRIRTLFLIPYVSAGVAECLAASLDRQGSLLAVRDGALETFAASVGFLIVGRRLANRKPTDQAAQVPVERKLSWVITIGLLLVVYIATLGHGIVFSR